MEHFKNIGAGGGLCGGRWPARASRSNGEHRDNNGRWNVLGRSLSVVIPTLDAAGTLEGTIRALRGEAGAKLEIMVADGGSGDGTPELAAGLGARVVEGRRGRGTQLRLGASHASGAWLLFLHADTRLEPGWYREAQAFIAEPKNAERAAVYRLALDSTRLSARVIERVAWARARALGLPYGDQALLISRPFYDALGGHPPLPIMEDVELIRRVGRRRLVFLETEALTSALRYEREGYLKRGLRNLACLALYRLGVRAETIARLYG